jgi:predicted transcriptional regulator
MFTQDVTVKLPENLYRRLQQAAQVMKRPFNDVLLRAVEVGSPPGWEDAPAAFQADLAALDRLDDETLWQIARSHQAGEEMERYQELLDKNANQTISEQERTELDQLRMEADRFMLRKVYAASLLRWRGHQIPPTDKL